MWLNIRYVVIRRFSTYMASNVCKTNCKFSIVIDLLWDMFSMVARLRPLPATAEGGIISDSHILVRPVMTPRLCKAKTEAQYVLAPLCFPYFKGTQNLHFISHWGEDFAGTIGHVVVVDEAQSVHAWTRNGEAWNVGPAPLGGAKLRKWQPWRSMKQP